MKGFKTALCYSRITLRDILRNISAYIVLLCVFLVAQYYCPEVGKYLKDSGEKMNLWELYIWSMSSRQSQLLYLAAIIGLNSQLIRLHGGTAYYLMRMDRRIWVRSQAISLFACSLAANVFLLACFAVAARGQVTLAGEWSRAAFLAAQLRNPGVIGLRGIFQISYSLITFDPNMIGLLSFVLAILLGMVMGLLLLVFALWKGTAFGGAFLFLLWMLDIPATEISFLRILCYILPFGMGRVSFTTYNYGSVTPTYCAAFLLILTVALIWVSDVVCDRVDFEKIG